MLVSGCSVIAFSTTAPDPDTIFTTTAGKPASSKIYSIICVVIGVIEDAFATTVFPVAKAGHTALVNR